MTFDTSKNLIKSSAIIGIIISAIVLIDKTINLIFVAGSNRVFLMLFLVLGFALYIWMLVNSISVIRLISRPLNSYSENDYIKNPRLVSTTAILYLVTAAIILTGFLMSFGLAYERGRAFFILLNVLMVIALVIAGILAIAGKNIYEDEISRQRLKREKKKA